MKKLAFNQRGSLYKTTNENALAFRTSNPREARAAKYLKARGYEILKRGWPDIIAVSQETGEIRLIEIKDHQGRLKRHQIRVAQIFARLGLDIEIWPEGDQSQMRPWRDDVGYHAVGEE